ncbi:MAG: hypothetical protein NTX19_10065 [Gemmatimonadetes bacterium]|nr:hypothetical protein [Gemmatimonadota bacterium]
MRPASTGTAVGESATAELFRLRRIAVVDGAWHLGFITAFGLTGIIALDSLSTNLGRSPGRAMALYILLICVAGLIGGLIGAACGHGIATVRERLDLRRNPRHFEADGGT